MPSPWPRAAAAEEQAPGCQPLCPGAPLLPTMGTLSCDPSPRLTTVPLGRRATECQIPETGLRRACGLATSESGRRAGGPWWWDPSLLALIPPPRWGFWNV